VYENRWPRTHAQRKTASHTECELPAGRREGTRTSTSPGSDLKTCRSGTTRAEEDTANNRTEPGTPVCRNLKRQVPTTRPPERACVKTLDHALSTVIAVVSPTSRSRFQALLTIEGTPETTLVTAHCRLMAERTSRKTTELLIGGRPARRNLRPVPWWSSTKTTGSFYRQLVTGGRAGARLRQALAAVQIGRRSGGRTNRFGGGRHELTGPIRRPHGDAVTTWTRPSRAHDLR